MQAMLRTAVLLAVTAGPLAAQATNPPDPTGLYATRAELEAMLARLQGAGADDGERGEQARNAAALVRARLEEGDFRVGDRIAMVVEAEPTLTDTFVVRTGQTLVLPVIGTIPLRGVLRSELESHLRDELRRYIRDPVVYARSLISITVTGQVDQPGFYELPAEARLNDALMAAGGPGRDARIEGIRVERDGEEILEGEALRQAMIEGRTLDQLNLRAGDRIVVPKQELFGLSTTASWLLLTVPGLILGALRIF
ncbi:MAG TPA: polysaccharide biosynthesis/export family protein [Longimicrobiales bacterium]